ncbi:MAG TPA: hypothetical protein VJR50_16615, partial [Mycobacterium sp.]|nr:hypothetical protein [Mycobacterium sp.]
GLTPDQNATMAVGYATLFNEPETSGRLKAKLGLPDGIAFEARTVAASPILIIEATASEPRAAQDAAQRMAEGFRDDINAVRNAGYEKSIQDTENQLDSLMSQREPDGNMNPLVPVVQARLDAMRGDAAGQLEVLQPRAGVTTTDTNLLFQLGQGVLGGLLLGVLAAMGLAALSPRLVGPADLKDKTGAEPLVEIPAGDSRAANRLREDRFRELANLISLQNPSRAAVIAVADSPRTSGATVVAEAVARLSAQRGNRTVLVYADSDASQSDGDVGFNDVLSNARLVPDSLHDGAVDRLKVLPAGSHNSDRYALMSRARIDAVVDQIRACADTVVIAAPPAAHATDSLPVCTAADFTILVVDKRTSRPNEVAAAVDALTDANAVLLGAVMIDGTITDVSAQPDAQMPALESIGASAGRAHATDRRSGQA